MPTLPLDWARLWTSQSVVSQASVTLSVCVGLSGPRTGRVISYSPSEPYLPRTSWYTRMKPARTKSSSAPGRVAIISGDLARSARFLALYGVRVSTMGASCASFGMTITV